jgi:hypothetical protein
MHSPWLPVDPVRFQRAVAVLRVRFIAEAGDITDVGGGRSETASRVEVLATLKNEPLGTRAFSGVMEILHLSGSPGVPPGISTVYLEPSPPGQDDTWILLGGSGGTGASDTVVP